MMDSSIFEQLDKISEQASSNLKDLTQIVESTLGSIPETHKGLASKIAKDLQEAKNALKDKNLESLIELQKKYASINSIEDLL